MKVLDALFDLVKIILVVTMSIGLSLMNTNTEELLFMPNMEIGIKIILGITGFFGLTSLMSAYIPETNQDDNVHKLNHYRHNILRSNIVTFAAIHILSCIYPIISKIVINNIISISILLCCMCIIVHKLVQLLRYNPTTVIYWLTYRVQIPYILLLSITFLHNEMLMYETLSIHSLLMNMLMWWICYERCCDVSKDVLPDTSESPENPYVLPLHKILSVVCLQPIVWTLHIHWFVLNRNFANILTGYKLLIYVIGSILFFYYRSYIRSNIDTITRSDSSRFILDNLLDLLSVIIMIIPVQKYDVYYVNILVHIYELLDNKQYTKTPLSNDNTIINVMPVTSTDIMYVTNTIPTRHNLVSGNDSERAIDKTQTDTHNQENLCLVTSEPNLSKNPDSNTYSIKYNKTHDMIEIHRIIQKYINKKMNESLDVNTIHEDTGRKSVNFTNRSFSDKSVNFTNHSFCDKSVESSAPAQPSLQPHNTSLPKVVPKMILVPDSKVSQSNYTNNHTNNKSIFTKNVKIQAQGAKYQTSYFKRKSKHNDMTKFDVTSATEKPDMYES